MLTALVVASSLAATSAAAGSPALDPGERMEFSVSYLGIEMGKARLSVGRPEGEILPVFFESRTTGAMSVITIQQQLASFLDVETGLPRRGSLEATEGDYWHRVTTRFDREAGVATVRQKGKHDNTYEIPVPPGTVDFVSLVFRLRALPLDPGSRHEFHVISGRKVWKVVAEVVGRETVSTPDGDVRAVKVKVPTGLTGKFSERHPTHVWFSDDDRRVVVRITSDFAIGHATASLVAYEPGKPAR